MKRIAHAHEMLKNWKKNNFLCKISKKKIFSRIFIFEKIDFEN